MKRRTEQDTEPEVLTLDEPYATRPIRFLELAERRGWQIKVYGISVRGERPDPDVVAAATDVASEQLPTPAVSDDRYGVAFLIVHEGREGVFVVLDWWFGENMLKHRVYFATYDDPTSFEDISETGIAACVWELRVLSFERDAWVERVLDNENGVDVDAYLSHRLDEDV